MLRIASRCAAALGLALMGTVAASAQPVSAGPYVPSPTVIVDRMLKMAAFRPGDVIADLGSGDGRIVITAAKRYGVRGFGVDIDEYLVRLATRNAAAEDLGDKVRFLVRDLYQTDLSEASVVTIYLLPGSVTKLVPKLLAELRPGTRIISHDYPLSPMVPDDVDSFDVEEKVNISGSVRTVLFHYTVPARLGGAWQMALPARVARGAVRLLFTQDATGIQGQAIVDGRTVPLQSLRVRGRRVDFTLPIGRGTAMEFSGTAGDEVIEGEVVSNPSFNWRASRSGPVPTP